VPREVIQAPEHDRNRSLGWLALAWLEHFAVHGPGDVQGRPLNPADPDGLPLDDEFAGLIVDHYALDHNGRRLYDSAFTSRAKGRSKSELAAFEVLFEAFAPCRFAGWAEGGEVFEWRDFRYEFQRGEPLGRPVVYPFIRCLATEESQAGNTYDNVYFNLTEGPLSEGLASNVAGLSRTLLPHGGEIVPSTASNAAKDGGKETHVVFDETHLYILPELRRMYATVTRNMVKRKDASPWYHETSTMYLPGENSTAEYTHKLASKISQGKVPRGRLFFDHRCGPENVDLANEVELRAALREVYGPFADVMDLERIIDHIWDPRNAPGDSKRYYLNLPTSAIDALLADYEWASCKDEEKTVRFGEYVTLGFDGSRGRARGKPDATALVGCRVPDGHLFEIKVWEAPDGPGQADWEPPLGEITAAIDDAFRRYRVVGLYADPAKDWRSYINTWESKYGKRVKVKVSEKHPFEWWMTGGRSIVNQRAIEQFEGAVRNGDASHDGSFKLTQHVLNTRRRIDGNQLKLAKKHDYSPDKIDACVAAVLAWQARSDAVAKGIGRQATGMIRRAR
jgi:hypothetical protein